MDRRVQLAWEETCSEVGQGMDAWLGSSWLAGGPFRLFGDHTGCQSHRCSGTIEQSGDMLGQTVMGDV